VGWVLRELRPVSFNFKDGPEAKYSRYGFIAQELQQVLPGVVRGTGEEHLKVVYQDLIALLTLAAQVLQDRVNQLSDALHKQEESTAALFKYIRDLDSKVERVLSGIPSTRSLHEAMVGSRELGYEPQPSPQEPRPMLHRAEDVHRQGSPPPNEAGGGVQV